MPEKARPEGPDLSSPWGPEKALEGWRQRRGEAGERELFLADGQPAEFRAWVHPSLSGH